jgi:diadenylate cyclase
MTDGCGPRRGGAEGERMDEVVGRLGASMLGASPLWTATWVDWLDMGLLAVLIYGVLRVLRGTRAYQVLLGIMLLAAVYLAAGALGLAALHWVLDGFFLYAVLAVLILFQEDLRRVLAQAGGTVFSGREQRQAADAQILEEIVVAAFQLASRRVGALIALERLGSLEPLMEGAHPVDARVSKELFAALFHPTSPVHDGAVVVQRGRLAKAGVFLPISLSKNLPKIFGTRHRAAIGLTERTDAVCVLVSEERGTVAVVVEGQVQPVADVNELRQRLQELLGDREARAQAPEVARA